MEFIHYPRFYGQPKLKKPKELKGIKQTFSIDYILKKCKCGVFVIGDDVWVRHKDYFSSSLKLPREDIGKPLGALANKYCEKSKKEKFVYPDAWGDIVLKNEAWIRLKGLMIDIKSDILS